MTGRMPRATLLLLAIPAYGADSRYTFSKDVLPIIQSRCQNCHRPGEIGPMPLLTYQQVRPWAAAIREAVLSGKMPPWYSDTPSQKFLNDPSLTAEEKEKIAAWATHGAPEGDPKDARPNPEFASGWSIGKPDRIVQPAKPFEVSAEGRIEYTYYIVPRAFEKDTWITASELRPSNRSVMHHGSVFLRTPDSKWLRNYPVGEYFVPEEQIPKPGVEHPSKTTNAGNGLGNEQLFGYLPGYVAEPYPDGQAVLAPAGSDLVFQLHYTTNGKAATDLAQAAFRFASHPPAMKHAYLTMGDDTFVIPPGAADYPVSAKKTLGADCELYGLFPHMHLRGKSMLLKATYPDGSSEILLNVPHYDFNWQLRYMFAKPKHLPAGTVLEAYATFDNSANNRWNPAPDREVRWGDQSWEEMMIGFFEMAIAPDMDRKKLQPPDPKQDVKPARAGNTTGQRSRHQPFNRRPCPEWVAAHGARTTSTSAGSRC